MSVKKSEIEEIIGKKKVGSSTFYLIKWKSKQATESSWKHQKLLRNIKKLVTEFNQQIQGHPLPIIVEKYVGLLQHKLDKLDDYQKEEVEKIYLPESSRKVQKIIGKAKVKVNKNIFYLVKWQYQSLSTSSWEESFKLKTRLLVQFNKSICQQTLPYIDTASIRHFNEVDQIQTGQKKSKKQQLREKKSRKNTEQNVDLLADDFLRKLKKIQKNIEREQTIKIMSEYKAKKQKQESKVQKPSDVKEEQHQKKQKTVTQSKEQNCCFPSLFDDIESGEMIDTIAKKIYDLERKKCKIEQQEEIDSSKDSIEQLKLYHVSDDIEYNQPQSQQQSEQEQALKQASDEQKHQTFQQREKSQKKQQHESGYVDKKILGVKFWMKVDSIASKGMKENLYRVQYTNGDVSHWTTSQLHQEHGSSIEFIKYLEQNTKWGK